MAGSENSDEQRRGFDVLNDPALNKSTAFTREERQRLGLRGLLPPAIGTQKLQVQRALDSLRRKANPIERYIYLHSLLARNERLFYRLTIDYIEEILPIVYTPTVGQACKEFAHIFRQTRGLYISSADRGEVMQLVDNWPEEEVQVVVITDGERILGLGDLGANGMGIPIGKLALYTALAGIAPEHTLPVMLDVGTDNLALRDDPLYLGLNQPRERGEGYFDLVDETVRALSEKFPGCMIQFEDFATPNAFKLLNRYQDKIPCFNDDIQGTAAVALAGIMAASQITGKALNEQTFMFLGAGSAATGIANLLVAALIEMGMSHDRAHQCVWFVDIDGLVVANRKDTLLPHNLPYAHDHAPLDFLTAIDRLKPDVLIGATGSAGSFTQEVIATMARDHRRPVVFALSNPTANAECTAEEAYRWSEGRVVFASGSPFGKVEYQGQTFQPGQGNNAYVFPGIGLGAILSGARTINTAMFLAAARALAKLVSQARLESGALYPQISELPAVSQVIAVAVAEVAFDAGLNTRPRPDDIAQAVRALQYDPTY
jgi:malate dehydrogenase (oxaloacetate-decarboxylating)(NADP+)